MPQTPSQTTLRHVCGVSWPRSGNGLLNRVLVAYFRSAYRFCNPFDVKANCCETFPCNRQDVIKFTKNHDFDFDLPQVEGVPYLVQHRAFLPSVVSNYELVVRNGKKDTQKRFRKFSLEWAERYRAFMSKWVLETPENIETICIPYEDLTTEPEKTISRVLLFFAPDAPVDTQRLADIINQATHVTIAGGERVVAGEAGIRDTRRIEDFRYYCPRWFEKLEKLSRPPLSDTVDRQTG